MNQDIQYTGFSAVPSDYACADGQLAASFNLVSEDGALQPVLPPASLFALGEGQTVVFIHKTASYTHYIGVATDDSKAEDEVFYIDSTDGTHATRSIGAVLGVDHFNAVGNTLLCFTQSGIYYFLWKDGQYVYLGDHLPNVQMSFGLVGHPRLFSISDDSEDTFSVKFTASDDYYMDQFNVGSIGSYSITASGTYGTFDEDDQSTVTSIIMAKVNKFIAAETVNSGRFCFPFFVRFAMRLYDGSVVCHSAPVLMNPSTSAAPVVSFQKATFRSDHGVEFTGCDIMLVAADLNWRLVLGKDALADWTDIISSVDVFISKPIYTYDQSGKIKSFNDRDNYASKFIGRLYADNTTSDVTKPAEDKVLGKFASKEFLNWYAEYDYSQIYAIYFSDKRTYPSATFQLPEFTDNKVSESITDNAAFYKLCSIDFDDIVDAGATRHDIVIDDDYLQSLATREVMTDDYLSHDQLHADYSFVYNARLNLAGVSRKPFAGFYPQSLFAFCNTRFNFAISDAATYTLAITETGTPPSDWMAYTFIKENGETYVVASEFPSQFYLADWFSATSSTGAREKRSWGTWFFYPNTNAYRMVIHCANRYFAVDLKAHDFLNGAYCLLDYEQVRDGSSGVSLPAVAIGEYDKTYPISAPNKLYTSEVNNPFYFPVTGINTVGTGSIMGICAAAKALSQGQFGQFPLYAFSDDGVWALEVSSTGTYSAKQPITRDVCISSQGITQLDSAVLFPTKRGLMLVSGSNAICISDAINSEFPFDATALPGFTKMHDMMGHGAGDACLPTMPFTEFLASSRMIYDYTHQRVIVYAPGVSYAYVYSLRTQQWGMAYSDIASHLNSYPNAMAMTSQRELVDYSVTDADSVSCLYVTRPLKLGAPDVLKAVDNVIQRGFFRQGHIASALYGSRDLFHWHLVWSSRDHRLCGFSGAPYKYYRVAGVGTIADDENIHGASVQFTTRHTNHPR